MELIKDAISWFEIPVLDFARSKKFYEDILQSEMAEMEMANIKMGVFAYDRDGGGVGGAICCGEGYRPSAEAGPRIYLNAGNDLNTVLSRVEAAGGQIVLPKSEISPDMGYFAFFTDTEGNMLGLFSMA